MRKLTSLALLAVTATLVAQSAQAQSLAVEFQPAKSRYARGERITVVVTFRNAWGQRCPFTWINVGDTWDRLPYWNWRSYCTDGNGQVRLPYTVPLDPNKDNVYIGALSWNAFGCKRIPIGL